MKKLKYGFNVGLAACFALLNGYNAVQAQQMDHMHHHHGSSEEGEWRMPPMDMSMPMAPGLDSELPPVQPFYPGTDHMVDMLPEAIPGQVHIAGGWGYA